MILESSKLELLLRTRCEKKVRQDAFPSTFVIIDWIPMSPTGKTDNRKLPRIQSCLFLDSINKRSTILANVGVSGKSIQ